MLDNMGEEIDKVKGNKDCVVHSNKLTDEGDLVAKIFVPIVNKDGKEL